MLCESVDGRTGNGRPSRSCAPPWTLLAHNVLLRSESCLAAKFLDFFTIPLLGEGPMSRFPMIMITDNGKMNPLGRVKYGAVM
jgi:hypothetical protein